jgi:hypothetical protein
VCGSRRAAQTAEQEEIEIRRMLRMARQHLSGTPACSPPAWPAVVVTAPAARPVSASPVRSAAGSSRPPPRPEPGSMEAAAAAAAALAASVRHSPFEMLVPPLDLSRVSSPAQ